MQLEIKNLSKTYANGVQALRGVTLTIPRGMYGLLGPNGAGKSTLMRTIATLQEPDSGSIRLGDASGTSGTAAPAEKPRKSLLITLKPLPAVSMRVLAMTVPG